MRKGGHEISEEIICKRYINSMGNFKKIQINFDNVLVLDNSYMYHILYRRGKNNVRIGNLPNQIS